MQPYAVEKDTGNPSLNVWSVDDITREIKRLLEQSFDRVWVEGEVVSCRPASSGHVYFKLKGSNASMSCVLFRSYARKLVRPLKDGDLVRCCGRVEVYAPHGQYQLVVQQVQLSGEGQLLAQYEALKRRLHQEGLFDPEHKRSLPFLPRRVGVITSPTGAAIRDIIRTVHERYPVPILLAPAAVQGVDAPAALINALNELSQVDDVDVIIIGRGGGSLEDLWAFNDENLVRAVASCPKPVISAVGHEIDRVLTDYVADQQAATPTGAGEAVVPIQREQAAYIRDLSSRLCRGVGNVLVSTKRRLRMVLDRLIEPERIIRDRWQILDSLTHRLALAVKQQQKQTETQMNALINRLKANHPQRRLAREKQQLVTLTDRLDRAWANQVTQYQNKLQTLTTQVQTLGPQASLSRGYAIVRRQSDGTVVRSHSDVRTTSQVEVLLADGAFDATVSAVRTGDTDT